MTAVAIRKKLVDYMKVADDKKIKAMYALLQDDIEQGGRASIEQYNKEINELQRKMLNSRILLLAKKISA